MKVFGKEYYDRAELAAESSLSMRTICRLDARREGPPRIKFGRKWIYPADQAREWMDARLEYQVNAPRGEA